MSSAQKHYKFVSFLLVSVLTLSLVGYPFVASLTSLLGVENRPFAIGFRLVLLLLSAILVSAIFANRVRVYRGLVWLPILVFWTLFFIRLWLDTLVLLPPLSRDPIEYWIWAIGGCLVPMVALMARADAVTSEKMLVFTFWFATTTALLVLLATRVGVVAGVSRTLEIGRLELGALNPVSAGHLGGSLILVATYLLIIERNSRRRLIKGALYLASVVIGLILLVVSGSRGAFGATAVAIVIFSVTRLRWREGAMAIAVVVFLVAASYQFANLMEDEFGLSPVSRLVSSMNPESDAGALNRLQSIGAAWEQFLESPLLGSGLEEATTSDYPHNVIVESFMATGVIGGMAFTFVILTAFLACWRLLKSESPQDWVALLCIQYLVGAQFSGSLWGNTVMWALVGAVFGLYVLPARSTRRVTMSAGSV